jgi:hypothetical protein
MYFLCHLTPNSIKKARQASLITSCPVLYGVFTPIRSPLKRCSVLQPKKLTPAASGRAKRTLHPQEHSPGDTVSLPLNIPTNLPNKLTCSIKRIA